ncbi:MAG: polysaccharide deacetylase family protein [Lachnospirales bacterium]
MKKSVLNSLAFVLAFVLVIGMIFGINGGGYEIYGTSIKIPMLSSKSVKSNIPILEYHCVKEYIPTDGSGYLYVTPDTFREQISTLKDNNYDFITYQDLSRIDSGKMDMPEKPVIITFDDGYLNNYVHAYPILDELGAKATFFVSTYNIREEEVEYDASKIYFMSWGQLREMEGSGVVDIQSHGHEHVDFANLTKEELYTNVNTSYDLIYENVGKIPVAISVPYGRSSWRSDKILNEYHKYIVKVYKDNFFESENVFYRNAIVNEMSGEDIIKMIE